VIARIALAISFALGAAPASAESKISLDGVWRGTLGKQAIVACFDGDSGRYYYDKHAHGIDLGREDNGPRFAEGGEPLLDKLPTGYWTVAVEGGQLRGNWSAPVKGKASQPIVAHRVALAHPDAGACDSAEFNAPRMAGVRVDARDATQQGVRVGIGKAAGTEVKRLQLLGSDAPIAAINRELESGFRESLTSAFDCNGIDGPGEYSEEPGIEFANASWLVVRIDGSGYCGGPHPDSWSNFQTFDRRTGRKVDTSKWLHLDPDATKAAFWKLLRAKVKPDSECAEAWTGNFDFVDVRPSAAGVRIDPAFPHVVAACADTAELGLREAAPFLTADAIKLLSPKK